MHAREFVNLLVKNGFATLKEIHGCSVDEIEKLEKHIGAKLPHEFREYLMLVGHGAGDFNKGSDYSFENLFHLTEESRKMMDAGPFKLPDDSFVFFSHQGYIIAYFKLSEGDNPPVYSYMEMEQEPLKWAPSFTEYLSKSLDEALDARDHMMQSKKRATEKRSNSKI
jgi:hypothetical protein